MRERNACCRRGTLERAHAWNDLKWDTGGFQELGFFSTSTEEERVAAFEPRHSPPGPGVLQHQLMDVRLGGSHAPAALTRWNGEGSGLEEHFEP